jgi:recombination protein RecA
MSTEKEAKLKALQLTLDKLDKPTEGTVMKMGIEPLSKWKLFLQGL